MRVAIELTALELDKGGTARAAEALVEQLRNDPAIELLTVRHKGREPKTFPGRMLRGMRRELFYLPRQLPRWVEQTKPDVLHCPAPLAPTRSAAPIVVTIHDVVPWDHPEWMTRRIVQYQQRLLPKVVERAAHVITSSDYSRDRMLEIFSLPPEKITTVPLGIDPGFSPGEADDAALSVLGVRRPFVLTVGTLQPRKNIEAAIAGFEQLTDDGDRRMQLVIAGARGWRDDELLQVVEQSPQSQNIHVTGRVDDAELVQLYRAAECFVFPSRYEGFGFPPLEAMACGTPVISSDRTSIPEAVGDAALIVDPDDHAAIGDALTAVLSSEELARDLRARGIEQAAKFTWARTKDLTVDVYRRVSG